MFETGKECTVIPKIAPVFFMTNILILTSVAVERLLSLHLAMTYTFWFRKRNAVILAVSLHGVSILVNLPNLTENDTFSCEGRMLRKKMGFDPVLILFIILFLCLFITTRFTVKISGDGSGDTSSFSTCSNLLTNSQANSNADFLRYSNSIDCGSGTTTTLTKQSTTLDTSGNLCSSSKEKITTSDFGEQCVSCRPGTYVLNGVCTACPDGLYQDVAGRTACKECPSGQVPDDNKAACRAVCPPGFTSSNGVTACTPCDVDEYSVNTTHCESCPSGSSTLNIKAVVNETGCKDYTGSNCDQLINPCDSYPCFNGGTCSPVDSMTYTCQCPVGM
ncbi:hypothetical protein FSP39_014943 [Pinctada imbricata]|uniref:EGF-like domain-containing protein n=1 Tax=Pinctada imbricata TaxID=66713 RepID=A0AA88XD93_PINIB|nr:hypothetical protein FSP39_014943 [Pinctada imbricata]